MAIGIGSNIASLEAQRKLAEATDLLSGSSERLSSGLRINRASDDAAGLSIALSLQTDTRIYTQAIRNVNDGISLLNVAEGAVRELGNITIRQKELAEQAASGVYSFTQRQALDKEAKALTNEYNRIIQSTKFNGVNLLDGSQIGGLTIQAGSGTQSTLTIALGAGLSRLVGTGSFNVPISYAAVSSPYGAELADLNGDGKPDVIAPNFGSNAVSVLLGNGDGSFQAQQTFVTGGSPRHVVVRDLNGDGKLDLATVDTSGATVSFLYGNGDGSFKARISIPLPWADSSVSGARDLAFGDFTGDGVPDLLVSDGYWLTGGSHTTVALFVGNGNGSFSAPHSYPVGISGDGTYDLFVGDVNHDGALDFSVEEITHSTVNTFLGNGDGTFRASASYQVGTGPNTGVILDLNNDGILDIGVNSFNLNSVSVLYGNADGTYRAQVSLPAGTNANYLRSADINGDGISDLLTSDYGASSVSVFLGNGDGTFTARISTQTPVNPESIIAGDVNGDGVTDLVVSQDTSNVLNVLIAQTSGTTLIRPVDLTSQASALSALQNADAQLTRVQTELGNIGAMQSRLGVGLRTLSTQRENETAAASRIMDADVASESAALVAEQVRQNAASAVLAHANQEPALALTLLH